MGISNWFLNMTSLSSYEAFHLAFLLVSMVMYSFSIFHGSMFKWSKKSALRRLSYEQFKKSGIRYIYRTYVSFSYYFYMLGVLLAIYPTLDVLNGTLMIVPTIRYLWMWKEIKDNAIDKDYEQSDKLIFTDILAGVVAIAHIVVTINNTF